MTLAPEVACDEASVVAGPKGTPAVVKRTGRKGRRRRRKGKEGRGPVAKERPPVLGMLQRGGQGGINRLATVKQQTLAPFIKKTIEPGTLGYTEEYRIAARLGAWG